MVYGLIKEKILQNAIIWVIFYGGQYFDHKYFKAWLIDYGLYN